MRGDAPIGDEEEFGVSAAVFGFETILALKIRFVCKLRLHDVVVLRLRLITYNVVYYLVNSRKCTFRSIQLLTC